jgi:enoyl-CoA hydratase/carnithine racemase
MVYQEILSAVEDGIATVTLNRPGKLNAWTGIMGREVRQAMVEAERDERVRVIVLTGAGCGFCAGSDMGVLANIVDGATAGDGEEEPQERPGHHAARPDFRGPYAYFPTIDKPIIAAVNGATAGLGLVIALYCDIRVSSDAAVFTTAFSRRGLVAEHGISWMLPRLIGLQNALDLLLSGRNIAATEAFRMGLVSQVLPAPSLMGGVREYARELATLVSPRSMRVMKRQLWDAQFQTLAQATAVANREMELSLTSEDFKEGVAHFLEKRAPAFTGR